MKFNLFLSVSIIQIASFLIFISFKSKNKDHHLSMKTETIYPAIQS